MPGNSSIALPYGGIQVASENISGHEHQLMIQANPKGYPLGDIPTYSAWSGAITAAANRPYMHIFNAVGSLKVVKMRKVFIQPAVVATALAGQTWRVRRTSTVGGAGNVNVNIRKHGSTFTPDVPAQITAGHSFTAGGTLVFDYFDLPLSVEETQPGVHMLWKDNILPTDGDTVSDYILPEGEGLSFINVTGGTYAWTVLAIFTIE
jgi:hypothetical protein